MQTVLKVQTTGREQISFQRNPSGSVEIVLVHPGQKYSYIEGIVPDKERGQPLDQKISSLRPEDLKSISDFFAQL